MVTAHALRGDVVDIEGVAAHDVGPSSLSSPRAVLLKFGSANRGSNYLMHLLRSRGDERLGRKLDGRGMAKSTQLLANGSGGGAGQQQGE